MTDQERQELKDELTKMRDAFAANPPADADSTFRLASHYYDLVTNATPVIDAAIKKIDGLEIPQEASREITDLRAGVRTLKYFDLFIAHLAGALIGLWLG